MRADANHYDLVVQPSLASTLALLVEGRHTPMAGGTELMVAFSAGRLPRKPLVSIGHLQELRFIRVEPDYIEIGSGTTFTDLRKHPAIARDVPLLAQAASWTGSIANQNRGTLGGNLVNASPAADAPPALLCYNAEVSLISIDGKRSVAYPEFHLGYKRTALLPKELIYSITVPRNHPGYVSFIRKVGTRNAQAISKIALAGLACVNDGTVQDIRIAAASLSEVPMRCRLVEETLTGKPINTDSIAAARAALASEARPIDDIRSTALYRAAVAANLLEEFLLSLR